MKKKLFYLSTLLLAVMMTIGCSKKEDDSIEGYFEYAGKTHSIKEAEQIFYGHYFGENSNNVSLIFATAEHYIFIDLFVPNSSTRLVEGTYEADNSYEEFTVSQGLVLKDESTILYRMIDGTLTVKLSGNVYTIGMEGTLEDNTSITGKFIGRINWVDGTEGWLS